MNVRCFEGKIEAVQKLKYTCLWLLAFWCNLEDRKDEFCMLDLIDSLQE